jgi:K+ transporter
MIMLILGVVLVPILFLVWSRMSSFGSKVLASIGVCFGDIGTSPLYAMFIAFRFIEASPKNVIGVTSLIIWSLLLIVTFWYGWVLMRIHHKEEGGIPALLAVAAGRLNTSIETIGIFGISLLYGDGAITPAISVLSALEGLGPLVSLPRWMIIVSTVLILGGLFLIQSRGTQKIGIVMGPLNTMWFVTILFLGFTNIPQHPDILQAFNPWEAIRFATQNPLWAVVIPALEGVVLSMTGGEAMYADRAHFGGKAVFAGWLFVFPCLAISYLGQGALMLSNPGVAINTFTIAHPGPFLSQTGGNWPLLAWVVFISTFATVFASQALITGLMSLTKQLIERGFLPGWLISLPSKLHEGQVYLPTVRNWTAVATIFLVLSFQTSEALADAYGIAVLGTMLTTTIVAAAVMIAVLKWRLIKVIPLVAVVGGWLCMFILGNLPKVLHAGAIPVAFGVGMSISMVGFHRHWVTVHSARKTDENLRLSRFWNTGMLNFILTSGNYPETIRLVNIASKMHSPYVIASIVTDENRKDVDITEARLRTCGFRPHHICLTSEGDITKGVKIIPHTKDESYIFRLESHAGDIEDNAILLLQKLREAYDGIILELRGQTIVEGSPLQGAHHQHGDRIQKRSYEVNGVGVLTYPLRIHKETLKKHNGHH